MHTTTDGVQNASDVCVVSDYGDFIGPLAGAVTFARVSPPVLKLYLLTGQFGVSEPPPLINLGLPSIL
ncbi:hypothetical protein H1R20_g5, partial [Candolleomyces eurysporus]